MFWVMLLFSLCQLIFFARGVEVSPWFNSGMYSARISPQPYYTVYTMPCRWPENIQLLSPQRDDKVFFTLDQFYDLAANDSMYNKVKKIFGMTGILSPNPNRFFCQLDTTGFYTWFSGYAASWVYARNKVAATGTYFEQKKASWNGKTLVLINETH